MIKLTFQRLILMAALVFSTACSGPVYMATQTQVDAADRKPAPTAPSPPQPVADLPAEKPEAPAQPVATTVTETVSEPVAPVAPVVAPAPPAAPVKEEVAVISTKFGRVVIQLDEKAAPKTVANFKKLIREGFYDRTTFHRVITNFMIQGGDPNSKTDNRSSHGLGGPGYTIPAEINLLHKRGAVATARTGDEVNPKRESSGSQFFICVADAPFLDGSYTVFGQVIEGMDVADKIVNQPKDPRDNPLDRIEMKVTLEPRMVTQVP